MDKKLFELCKEVYKRTGWKDTHDRIDDGHHQIRNEGNGVLLGTHQAPLYTSDYLLEKLPPRIWNEKERQWDGLHLEKWEYMDKVTYTAEYWTRYFAPALKDTESTPLKALLKLVIALDDANQLPKSPKEDPLQGGNRG